MHAWQEHRHGESKLYGDNIQEGSKSYDLWRPENAAADCYPFHVLTASLTEPEILQGAMIEMLESEISNTSRDLGDGQLILPDVWNVAAHEFENPEVDIYQITFGVSEYCKDGLMPISEWMGTETPWYDRMITMTDYLWEHQLKGKSDLADSIIMAAVVIYSRTNVEAHGEQLQVLPRLYFATGEEKYKDWAIRLGDHYLLGDHHPTEDFSSLRLRDHGNEIISGLTELYAMLSVLGDSKADEYREPLYRMLDRVLEGGRNEDGLFHDNLHPKEQERSGRIADNFGYVYNAYYIAYMIDRESPDPLLRRKVEHYRHEMIRALENLDQSDYYSFNWENYSSDGYADALEGAINLYNRERNSRLEKWIDSEIKVMWGFQGDQKVSQKNYPDGNFNRTSLMYSLWKTQGIHTPDWREDLEFGALPASNGSGLLFSVFSKTRWKGALKFDRPRHRTSFHMPMDYPRINQFPEWYTVEEDLEYKLGIIQRDGSCKWKEVSGKELIEGYMIHLPGGEEMKYVLRPMDSYDKAEKEKPGEATDINGYL